jgi:hypothetical protein
MTVWHADPTLLLDYARGDIDEARAYSVEAHLLVCETCRVTLARGVDREPLKRIWAEIEEVVDAPRPGIVEHGLLRLGVREHVARLLAATPSLRLSWFAAEAVALGFAVLAANGAARGAHPDLGLLVFLVVAAILPVGGVAVAYGPGVDPTYEVGVASPMRSHRLLLIRAAAVLATSTLLAGGAALLLPQLDWEVAVWLLPSLGLVLASLALATAVRPLTASGAVTCVWIAVAMTAAYHRDDRLIVFRGAGQVAFVLVILVSALVLARRREVLDTGRSG